MANGSVTKGKIIQGTESLTPDLYTYVNRNSHVGRAMCVSFNCFKKKNILKVFSLDKH